MDGGTDRKRGSESATVSKGLVWYIGGSSLADGNEVKHRVYETSEDLPTEET